VSCLASSGERLHRLTVLLEGWFSFPQIE